MGIAALSTAGPPEPADPWTAALERLDHAATAGACRPDVPATPMDLSAQVYEPAGLKGDKAQGVDRPLVDVNPGRRRPRGGHEEHPTARIRVGPCNTRTLRRAHHLNAEVPIPVPPDVEPRPVGVDRLDLVRDREDLINSSRAPTTRCWGGRGIVRPTFSACARRRQGASLRSAPAPRGSRP